LDFEIYLLDGKPIVAASSVDDYDIKQTYNHIGFDTAMKTIENYAFASSTSAASTDPIILHLRIKSNISTVYDELAKVLELYNGRMLGPSFSYENNNKNIGDIPILDLKGKYIIIVDRTNPGFVNTPLLEYINLTSNSMFARKYTYDNVKNNPDVAELTQFNKKNMTIVVPDKGEDPTNPSSILCHTYGCQMVAMRYQYADEFLMMNINFFDRAMYSFVLKPEKLRYKPVVIRAPDPQKPELSYATRNVTTDYYSMDF